MPTVREAYEIGEIGPVSSGSFSVGREAALEKAETRRTWLSTVEADARLADYIDDVAAGASDGGIAQTAGLTPRQVAAWRRRQGISRPRGRPGYDARFTAEAVDVFGARPTVAMTIKSSGFDTPKYLVRVPMDYDLFCFAAATLASAGTPHESIARGLGVRLQDVRRALGYAKRPS